MEFLALTDKPSANRPVNKKMSEVFPHQSKSLSASGKRPTRAWEDSGLEGDGSDVALPSLWTKNSQALSVKWSLCFLPGDFSNFSETVQISFPSRLDYVPVVVSYLTEVAARLKLIDADESNFPVVVDEALTNAVVHGNRSDHGKLVHVRATFTPHRLEVAVRDEGQGFDYDLLPNPLEKDNLHRTHGRGIFLIRSLVDELRFNEAGNEIILVQTVRQDAARKRQSSHPHCSPARDSETP